MQFDLTATFIGLPNTGKSLIYNLVTGQNSEVTPYLFSTVKPQRGVIEYADSRMNPIAYIIEPEQLYPLNIQFIDIIGVVPERQQGVATTEALGMIRSSDILVHVLRAFDNPSTSHTFESIDFERDSKVVELELCNADLSLLENRLDRLDRMVRRGKKEKELVFEHEVLIKAKTHLDTGIPLLKHQHEWGESEIDVFTRLNLITHKPICYIVNYGEGDIRKFSTTTDWSQKSPFMDYDTVALCAQLETEISQLGAEEQEEFLGLYEDLELAADRIPSLILRAAGRITYFTYGHLGLKQWSIPTGTAVVDAAKRLHTDFANRFVAAEVMTAKDLLEAGSADALKNQGGVRVEGKEYIVQDGDILYFRFGK